MKEETKLRKEFTNKVQEVFFSLPVLKIVHGFSLVFSLRDTGDFYLQDF